MLPQLPLYPNSGHVVLLVSWLGPTPLLETKASIPFLPSRAPTTGPPSPIPSSQYPLTQSPHTPDIIPQDSTPSS
jgi:hypothetical protein